MPDDDVPAPRPDPRLARLAELAELVRDLRLVHLQTARQRREAMIALRHALQPAPCVSAHPVEQLAALRHAQWAGNRRRQIDAEIRKQDEIIRQERDAAARAVARAAVTGRLCRGKGRDQPS